MNPSPVHHKLDTLRQLLTDMKRVVVAYSGGVDSTFLLKVAVDTLGEDALGLIAISPSYPEWELQEARTMAQDMDARIIEVFTDEMERAEYRANAGDRCYFCKTELFSVAADAAKEMQFGHLCYGAIPDDLGDHRPGMTAAGEWSVRAPLIESGLSKAEIRALSQSMGLPTWDKPASACLASRFPFGIQITREKIQQVERCEDALRALGFREFRARYHEHLVRLEFASDELTRIYADPKLRSEVTNACKSVGFKFVSVDLEGYRSGSANDLVTITN